MSDRTFFTDRDFGPTPNCDVVQILRSAGLHVECHDLHFGQQADDWEWLRKCGAEGWIPLTKDRRISYTPLAKGEIMEAGVKLFVMIGQYPHSVLARNFVNTVHLVERRIEEYDEPFIARVYTPTKEQFNAGKAGRVDVWETRTEWRQEQ